MNSPSLDSSIVCVIPTPSNEIRGERSPPTTVRYRKIRIDVIARAQGCGAERRVEPSHQITTLASSDRLPSPHSLGSDEFVTVSWRGDAGTGRRARRPRHPEAGRLGGARAWPRWRASGRGTRCTRRSARGEPRTAFALPVTSRLRGSPSSARPRRGTRGARRRPNRRPASADNNFTGRCLSPDPFRYSPAPARNSVCNGLATPETA